MMRLWLIVVNLVICPFARTEDWPYFRGPRDNGTFRASIAPESLSASGLKEVWKTALGGGYAGIVVADGRVFTMDRPGPVQKGKNPDGIERVLCLDAESGRELWRHEYPAHYGTLDYGNGPRAAPTVHRGKVYTLGAVGRVTCLDAATGKLLWTVDAVQQWQARMPTWGFAAAPFCRGDTVAFVVGGTPDAGIVCLDAATGQLRWKALPDEVGYSPPIEVEAPSGRQWVLWTAENVVGLDPRNGAKLWSVPYKVTYNVAMANPLYADGIALVAGYWEGSKAIELGASPSAARVIWEDNRDFRGIMASPLYKDGHVYLLDKAKGFTCLELKTGKKRWDDGHRLTRHDRNPHLTAVWLNGGPDALILNAAGELIHARLTPLGVEGKNMRARVCGSTWSIPAFAGDSIYVRSDHDNDLRRIRLTAAQEVNR